MKEYDGINLTYVPITGDNVVPIAVQWHDDIGKEYGKKNIYDDYEIIVPNAKTNSYLSEEDEALRPFAIMINAQPQLSKCGKISIINHLDNPEWPRDIGRDFHWTGNYTFHDQAKEHLQKTEYGMPVEPQHHSLLNFRKKNIDGYVHEIDTESIMKGPRNVPKEFEILEQIGVTIETIEVTRSILSQIWDGKVETFRGEENKKHPRIGGNKDHPNIGKHPEGGRDV